MGDLSNAIRREGAVGALALDRTRLLRGVNIHHDVAVIEATVRLDATAKARSAAWGDAFVERYLRRFDRYTRAMQAPALDPDLAAALRGDAGAPLINVVLAAVLAVEAVLLDARNIGERIAFARTLPGADAARHVLVWETQAPRLSRRAAALAVEGVATLLDDLDDEAAFEIALAELREIAAARAISSSTAIIKAAATARGLPTAAAGELLIVGHGARQQRFFASLMGRTSFVATKLVLDKRRTSRVLRRVSVPVPAQRAVKSAEEAFAAAREIGLPVVIKPAKGNQGRGVTSEIGRAQEVAPAFDAAKSERAGVVVEAHQTGEEHRLLVIGGRFVAATRRKPPVVTGDGRSSIRALVDALNAGRRREGLRPEPVAIDAMMLGLLAREGLSPETVLDAGRVIALRSTSNVSTGGSPIDVTDEVHPDNRSMAERAAVGLGIDIAGVDFITPDIARSYREVGGVVIEVNARPGLGLHAWPHRGASRPVGEAVLDLAFPPGAAAAPPTLVIGGDRGTARVARAVERRLAREGLCVGLLLRASATLGGQPVEVRPDRRHRAIRTLLLDRATEALVCAASLRQAAVKGLGLDRCDAAAILRRRRADDTDAFAQGAGILARCARRRLVAPADMADAGFLRGLPSEKILLVFDRVDDPRAHAHIAAGGGAVIRRWRKTRVELVVVKDGETVAAEPLPPTAVDVETEMLALALCHAVERKPSAEAALRRP